MENKTKHFSSKKNSRPVYINKITGEVINYQNGVNFGWNAQVFCEETAYLYGFSVAQYMLTKRPEGLSELLVKYRNFQDTTGFIIPQNMNQSNVKDLTILANIWLIFSKLLASGSKENANKKAPNPMFLEDLFQVMSKMYPNYVGESNIGNLEKQVNKFDKYANTDGNYSPLGEQQICEIWACTLFLMMQKSDDMKKEVIFFKAILPGLFSIVLAPTQLPFYAFYPSAIKQYAEKQNFYEACPVPEIKRSKHLIDVFQYVKEKEEKIIYEKAKEWTQQEKSKISIDEIMNNCHDQTDLFVEELATILLINGYDMFSNVSKTDMITAMQVRGAFHTYNGKRDKGTIYKTVVDVVLSTLSRKYKESLLQTEKITNTSIIQQQTNDQLLLLQKENEDLKKENRNINEQLSFLQNKENKKDSKIESLETKINDVKEELLMKQAEIDSLRMQLQQLKMISSLDFDEKTTNDSQIDYKEQLNIYSKEHSILIIGGNPNLISKLKPLFPFIVFLSDKEKSKITNELIANAHLVLYKTDSLGHGTWCCAGSKCKTLNIPEGFISNLTNVDALAKEICETIEQILFAKNK